MAHVCLVTFGSAGDVHPLLALGQALRLRGHQVRMLTNPAFATVVEQAGLVFDPIGSQSDWRATVEHPKLWHPVDGLGVLWRYLLRPALVPTYQRLHALAQAGAVDVVLASPLAMGARVAQERLGLPLVTAYTATTMLRTTQHPMTLAQWTLPRWLPQAARQGLWRLLDHYKLQPLVRPALEALRGSLGLAPVSVSLLGQWLHSPQAGVALFPAWFAPAASDWPKQVVQLGFPLFEDAAVRGLEPGLEQFLQAGAAPVVFMPGSAMQQGEDFFHAALAACAHSGQRGVLLGALPAALRTALPAHIYSADYAPFAALLPRAQALVHHGGIGSSAQALQAGVPQLLVPQAYDQFDNAQRLQRLGVGVQCRTPQLRLLGARLVALLARADVAAACRQWAGQSAAQQARAEACAVLERCLGAVR